MPRRKSKAKKTFTEHLHSLPYEIIELILICLAYKNRRLACAMCRMSRSMKYLIETHLYGQIYLDNDAGRFSGLMYTMRKRSKEFFQRNVKTLKLESHEPLARINTVISLCQSIDTLELLSLSTPEATDEPSELLDYFDNLTKLTIRHLVINLDCHLRNAALLHLDFPFVIFENLTHLDVVCAENRQFVNNVLPIMLRLQRLIINPWKYTISYEQLLVFVSNIKDNFPLSLELCAIFIHHPPTATEHLITRPKLVEVARGTTDRRIALAFPFDRLNNLQDKGLWERNGYRSLLSSWCLIGPGSPDVWQQMDEILRQRRGKRARLTMYERINDAPTSQVLVWYPPQRNTP